MPQSLTLKILSGSTNGKQIKVAADSSPGTTIHTAHTADLDEIWLWADNDNNAAETLVIEWGGTTSVDNTIKVTIPATGTFEQDGAIPVVRGLLLTGGLVIKAYSTTANKVKISGYVKRYTSA